MIIKSVHISSADSERFMERVEETVKSMQNDGLKVEVQYHPVVNKDEYLYVVYTALIIGRRKKERKRWNINTQKSK